MNLRTLSKQCFKKNKNKGGGDKENTTAMPQHGLCSHGFAPAWGAHLNRKWASHPLTVYGKSDHFNMHMGSYIPESPYSDLEWLGILISLWASEWVIECLDVLPWQVFNKLIRRYKYLEKGFEEEIKKVSPQTCPEPDLQLEMPIVRCHTHKKNNLAFCFYYEVPFFLLIHSHRWCQN